MGTRIMTGHGTSDSATDDRLSPRESHALHYRSFAMMVGLSFVAMSIVMYSMVNTFGDVFNNVN